jgi:hypothetical protein
MIGTIPRSQFVRRKHLVKSANQYSAFLCSISHSQVIIPESDLLFKSNTLPSKLCSLEHLTNLRSPHRFDQRVNMGGIRVYFDPFRPRLEERFVGRQGRLVEDVVVELTD